jgi:hypothetical protein
MLSVEHDTAALVARRPAIVASSTYLAGSDATFGCGVRELGPDARLTATFTPPPGVSVDGPAGVDVPIRRGLLSASWRVVAQRPGVTRGRVRWAATAPDGTVRGCPTDISLRIVAAAGPPTLRAVSAARFSGGEVVVLESRLPGVSLRRLRSFEYPSAFDAFFTDHPERVYVAGEAGRRVGDAFFARDGSTMNGFGFGPDGRACVRVAAGHRLASLRYRIRFTWNHEVGARSLRTSGSLPVHASPSTRSERSCARSFEALTGPVEGS